MGEWDDMMQRGEYAKPTYEDLARKAEALRNALLRAEGVAAEMAEEITSLSVRMQRVAALLDERERRHASYKAKFPDDRLVEPQVFVSAVRAALEGSSTCRRCGLSKRAAIAGVLCEPPHARSHDFRSEGS